MIARALRASSRASEITMCVREHSFRDMYRALGNDAEHEEIRAATENFPHCYLLRQSSRACISLPESIEGGPAQGEGCPNNPFLKPANQPIYDADRELSGITERALALAELSKRGLLGTADHITPAEFQTLIAVDAQTEVLRAEDAEIRAAEQRRNQDKR